jgi:sortase (surface protein transpeptidase)
MRAGWDDVVCSHEARSTRLVRGPPGVSKAVGDGMVVGEVEVPAAGVKLTVVRTSTEQELRVR